MGVDLRRNGLRPFICVPGHDDRIFRQLSPRIHSKCDAVMARMKYNFLQFNVELLSALDLGDRVRRRDTSVAFGSPAGSRFLGIAQLVLDNPRLRLDQSEMSRSEERRV